MATIRAWLQRRMARGPFWLASLALWLAFYLLSSLVPGQAMGVAVWLINLPALTVLLGLCVRRLHDGGRSGWWLLAVLLPVLGAAWLFWQLACKTGGADDNRWGKGRHQTQGDYLRVP